MEVRGAGGTRKAKRHDSKDRGKKLKGTVKKKKKQDVQPGQQEIGLCSPSPRGGRNAQKDSNRFRLTPVDGAALGSEERNSKKGGTHQYEISIATVI